MSYAIPPIVKLAESLVVQVYQAVRGFHRYHKYTIGTELQKAAMCVLEYAHRTWRERDHQVVWTRRLVIAIDTLKLRMQIGSRLRAFASFGQFEALMHIAVDVGRQAGGWYRQQRRFPWLASAARPRRFAPSLAGRRIQVRA